MEWMWLVVAGAIVAMLCLLAFLQKEPEKCCICEKCDKDCPCKGECGYQCKICYPTPPYTPMPPMH